MLDKYVECAEQLILSFLSFFQQTIKCQDDEDEEQEGNKMFH